MKRFLLAIVCTCFAVSVVQAQAQTSDWTMLRLKSGVEVRGEIVEMIPDVSVTLKDANGDTFYYRMDEVARIEMGKQEKSKVRESKGLGNFKGYRGIVEAGSSYGITGLHHSQITVSFINGYNFGSYFFMGLGVGVSLSSMYHTHTDHDYDSIGSYVDHIDLPIFLHLRSAFLKNRRVSPFIAFSAGYNINVETMYDGICPAHVEDKEGNHHYPSVNSPASISSHRSVPSFASIANMPFRLL